jgi:hypothetical protein
LEGLPTFSDDFVAEVNSCDCNLGV